MPYDDDGVLRDRQQIIRRRIAAEKRVARGGLSQREWEAKQKAERLARERAEYLLSVGNSPERVYELTGVKV